MNLVLGIYYFTTYKISVPPQYDIRVGSVVEVVAFQNSSLLSVVPFEGIDIFQIDNPYCKDNPCSGSKIWVDLKEKEIYIEDENITYVDFKDREELIFYLGAMLYELANKKQQTYEHIY